MVLSPPRAPNVAGSPPSSAGGATGSRRPPPAPSCPTRRGSALAAPSASSPPPRCAWLGPVAPPSSVPQERGEEPARSRLLLQNCYCKRRAGGRPRRHALVPSTAWTAAFARLGLNTLRHRPKKMRSERSQRVLLPR